jgi:hypothetical protein
LPSVVGVARLAVRAREHRHVRVARRERVQARDDAVDRRQQHAFAPAFDHARVREVVDVLGGAGEVDELGRGGDLGVAAKRSRSQYSTAFTSWLVVASIAFTRSASASANPARRARARRAWRGRRASALEAALVGERQQPGDLDRHALADERELAEVLLQRRLLRRSARRGARGR